jgi:hypothetical protein
MNKQMQINNIQDLNLAIATLESRKTIQEKMLRNQFNETVESFKPKNLIKAAYKSATENGGAGSLLLKAAGGIGAGLLGNNLLVGKGGGLLGKIAGTAINAGALDSVVNNTDKISAWGKAIYRNLFKKKKETPTPM